MNKIDDTLEIDANDYEDAPSTQEEFYDETPVKGKLNPLVAVSIAIGGTLALVLCLLIIPMSMASANGDQTVLDTVESVADDVLPSSRVVPGADTYALGELSSDGQFVPFEGNVAPEDVTSFVVRVTDEDQPQLSTDVETVKPQGVEVQISGLPARAGHFTVSAFSDDSESYAGPEFLPGQAATYNSLTASLEVY